MKKITFLINGKLISTLCLMILTFVSIYGQNDQLDKKNIPFAQWTWNNAKISSIYSHIAKLSGVDFVIDPGVSGNLTLSVTNKTWQEVSDIVCRMMNLVAVQETGYIYIMSQKDLVAKERAKEVGKQSLSEIVSLKREIIQFSNTNVEEMKDPISDLLSKRGKCTVVKHTNSIIIYDTEDNIAHIKELVRQLDIEVEQISISAKIIEVSSGTINNLGIQWSLFDDRLSHLPTSTKGQGIIASALERASYGIIGAKSYAIAMEYLFGEGKSDVIAQPQITTLDNKEAKIFMGSQVPVTYKDIANNTMVKMIDAGTQLQVTPHVTSNGRIVLNLNPSKKSYEFSDAGIPIIKEQSAQTNVVVDDGETVVIAGLTTNEKYNSEAGIPVLKDIPLIGHLFKRSTRKNDKKDLIIFVTPHIIKKDFPGIFSQNKEGSMTTDSIEIPAE